VINAHKARIIAGELSVLDDAQAAEAEKLVLADLAGKTPGQLGKLAALAAATVDPEGTQKRREQAERDEARVRIWREHSGATAMAAYGLPPTPRWPPTPTSNSAPKPTRNLVSG